MLDHLSILLLGFPLGIVLAIILFLKKKPLKNIFWIITWYVYFLLVASAVFFPFPLQFDVIISERELNYLHNNFVPFQTIIKLFSEGEWFIIRNQILGNILLTAPFGCFLYYRNKSMTFSKVVLFSFIFSLSIELSQYLISYLLGYTYKITDVDDLMLNTLGTTLGYYFSVIFIMIYSLKNSHEKNRKKDSTKNA